MTDFTTESHTTDAEEKKVADLIGVLTGKNDQSEDEPAPEQPTEIDDVSVENNSTLNPCEGQGLVLSKHPNVQVNIKKLASEQRFEDLKSVHKFLYGTTECKNENLLYRINKFSGLEWDESDTEKHENRVEVMRLYTVNNIKWVMDMLDISKPPSKRTVKTTEILKLDDGTEKVIEMKKIQKAIKDDYIEICMIWMYKPFINTGERPRPSGKSLTDAIKRKIKKISKALPKKKVKLDEDAKDSDSEDDKPLVSFKKPPTGKQIKQTIRQLLDGADLEQITMKTVCQQVYSLYPSFTEDLISRKSEIKGIIRDVLGES